MSAQLHLHTASLERGPVRLEGTLPASVLELDGDPSVRNPGEITYTLLAERKSSDVLIRGSVEITLELECSRSGRFFSTTLKDSAFMRDYSISEHPSGMIDLTEDVRETVLLALPVYPVSPEARSETFIPPGVSQDNGGPVTGSSPWSALNNLNLP
jgi:uncharacterized metal-binding protein YceD (DUF177 family)